jgi:beta-phosphoglucomutase-like phosphatase (HAD superfamily)
MPQAAIFDLDGTLVDSVDLHASAWLEALIKSVLRLTEGIRNGGGNWRILLV